MQTFWYCFARLLLKELLNQTYIHHQHRTHICFNFHTQNSCKRTLERILLKKYISLGVFNFKFLMREKTLLVPIPRTKDTQHNVWEWHYKLCVFNLLCVLMLSHNSKLKEPISCKNMNLRNYNALHMCVHYNPSVVVAKHL